MHKPVFTLSQIINQIDSGTRWNTTQLNYGFATRIPAGGFPSQESDGISQFSTDQREATRIAIVLWADLININFVETSETTADILLVNYTGGVGPAVSAFAYFPPFGDVFVNPNEASNFQLNPGEFGLGTLVHELGHALGLSHPGDYDSVRGGLLSYRDQAEYEQDSLQYSVMSYWYAPNTGADHGPNNYAATPLIHDIATIQSIYGANLSTRTGNTVYGFNSTANRDVFNFSSSFYATKTPIIAIWDAGGTDTLDLSGYAEPARIDLNDGAFSDAGGLTLNISIAFNAFIENAVGGSGNDRITGQELANRLNGGRGNDVLTGAAGNDVLIGGSGTDVAIYSGVVTDYSITSQGGDQYTITGPDGTDTLSGIERLQFDTGTTYTIDEAIRAPELVTDPITAPTFTLASNADSVDESGTATFSLTGSGTAVEGDQVTYTISGIDSSDTTSDLTGTATLDANLSAVISVVLIADATTEGAETLMVTLSDGTVASTIVNDTSVAPSGEAGDSYATAKLITLNTSLDLDGTIGFEQDEEDYYVFTAATTGSISATVSGLSADVALFVYDISSFLGSSSSIGGSNSSETYNVQQGSTYYLIVTPYFVGGQSAYTVSLSISSTVTDPVIPPTFTLASNADSVDESGTATFSLTGSGTAVEGDQVTYTISGIDSSDTTSDLTGTATLDANLSAVISVVLIADATTEGAETLMVTLSDGTVASTIVNDTSVAPSGEAGDSYATAKLITLNTSLDLDGTIGFEQDEEDYYVFTAATTGSISATVSGLSADVALFVYDISSFLGSSSSIGGSNSSETYNVQQGSTYYLIVTPYFVGGQSDYTVSLSISSTVIDASDTLLDATFLRLVDITLTGPATVSQSVGFASDDDDYFQIRPDSSGELHLTLTDLSSDIDLFVYDSVFTIIATSNLAGSSSEEIFLNVLAGDTYYIGVEPFGIAQSNYTLKTELQSDGTSTVTDGNDTIQTAASISLPATVSQTIGFNDDNNDFFSFTATQNGTVTVELQGLSSDIDLNMLSSSGSVLTSSTNSGSASEALAFYVTNGITYYIEVFPYLDFESTYELTTHFTDNSSAVDAGNSFSTASSLTLGEAHIQDVGGNNDSEDFFRVVATSVGTLNVNISSLSADIDIYLFDSNQNQIAASTLAGTSDETISQAVTPGDVFFLNISPYQTAESSYTLVANITNDISEISVQELYISYFGRPADPAGLAFYAESLGVGATTINAIASSFSDSTEAQAIIVLSTDAYLTAMYLQAFARAYDNSAGADGTFWFDAIERGATTKELAMVQILSGAQGTDITAVANKVAVSRTFTDAVFDNGASYAGADAADAARAVLDAVTSDFATVDSGNTAAQSAVSAFAPTGVQTTSARTYTADDSGTPTLSLTGSDPAYDEVVDITLTGVALVDVTLADVLSL